MNASKVKDLLTDQDIYNLLEELGAEPELGTVINSRTRCHNSAHEGKHKLYYYSDTKTFRCYTGCGSMDIFGLIMKIFDLDFYQAYKYICSKFGIDSSYNSYDSDVVDTSYFKRFKRKNEIITLNKLDEGILKNYFPIYHESWIKDGISIESMKKYGIKFSIINNQIIIPHRDEKGQLVGIRSRNLNKELVDNGKKYMPVWYRGKSLKHPTGACLYGLDINKEDIEKYKTVIIFESEKSVLQLDTMFPEKSIGVCISGSNLSNHQLELLKKLDISEVVIALDKEFNEVGSEKEKFYAQKIEDTISSRLIPYFTTSVIWDVNNLINEKSSPTDHGRETFSELFNNRIFL